MEKVGVFISIPKCATKTILKMYDLGRNRDNDSDENNHYIIYENHQRLAILEKKYDLSDKFIFTFVRHPYSRIKSWFNYHKYDPIFKNISLYQNTNLNDWVKNGCKTHWRKQNMTDWMKEEKSPLLQYNFIEGNTHIDYIGKIENFEEDNKNIISKLNKLFSENNIPKYIKYSKIKKNESNADKDEELTTESKEIIYKLFKKDFDYFNYSKII